MRRGEILRLGYRGGRSPKLAPTWEEKLTSLVGQFGSSGSLCGVLYIWSGRNRDDLGVLGIGRYAEGVDADSAGSESSEVASSSIISVRWEISPPAMIADTNGR